MDRVFKSKVGWWYHMLMGIVIVFCIMVVLKQNVWAIVCMLLIAALMVHVLLDTWYRVTADGELIAHCSIFPEKRIRISDIEALEASSMPVSSYSLSLDRIIVWTEGKPWMLISPKAKKEFVTLLRKLNPEIEIRN